MVVGNDANHATLAEWTWGLAEVLRILFILHAQSRLVGIIINNHLYKGSNGMAAEFGHLIIDNIGPVCFCGCRGCLTTFISRTRNYNESLQI